jgi:hypothetical protein
MEQSQLANPGHSTAIDYLAAKRVFVKSLRFRDQITVVWGWAWRSLCIGVIVYIVAFVLIVFVLFLIDLVFVSVGRNVSFVRTFLFVLLGMMSLFIGFASELVLIDWLSKSRIGDFELWLLRTKVTTDGTRETSPEEEQYLCDKCGSAIDWGDPYCRTCGDKLDYAEQS